MFASTALTLATVNHALVRMRKRSQIAASIALALAALECRRSPTAYEYVRVQNEDGLAMEAPITFRVRVRVDTAAKTVTWLEDVRDIRGVEDRRIRTYGGSLFSSCEVFDEMNWWCTLEAPSDGEVVERPEMKDGQLSRFYWTETHHYERRRLST